MKKILAFLIVLCTMIGAKAQTWTLPNTSTTFTIENGVGTLDVANPGDLNGFSDWSASLNSSISGIIQDNMSSLSQLVVKGNISSSDASKLVGDPFKNYNGRLNYLNVEGSSLSFDGGAYSVLYLPAGSSVNNVSGNYAIINNNPLDVYLNTGWGKYNSAWTTDEYVVAANSINVHGEYSEWDSSAAKYTSDLEAMLNAGKTVNGEKAGVLTKDLTINADTEDEAAVVAAFLADGTQQIGKLTVSGTLSDPSFLRDIEVQSADFSALTSIENLVLPKTSGEISLPSVKYSNASATSTGSDTQLFAALKVLVDNGKTVNDVTTANGSKVNAGTLTVSASDNLEALYEGITEAGVNINAISFPNGTTYQNGVLTVAAADDTNDGLKAIADKLSALGLDVTRVVLSDKTFWENNSMTTKADETAQAALKEKLENAGFTVDNIVSSSVQGTYVTEAGGVTTFTMPAGMNWNDVRDKLTAEEKQALKDATTLKLVGKFVNDPDFLNLKSSTTPTTLDLRDADIQPGTPVYTYYYLDEEADKDHKRKTLTQDAEGWYYTDPDTGSKVYVEEDDVRIYSASVSDGQALPSEWKQSLETLYLPENPNYNVTGESFANGFENLKTVYIPENITFLGNKTFYGCNSLVDVELPSKLKVIGYQAFYKTALKEITIPGSVEIIEYMAFTECEEATTLIFEKADDDPNHHMIMKYYAMFNLCNLHDIYVETTSFIDCENEAFDYRITWGQGNVNAPFCTLHFSEEVASHYANLAHPLTTKIAKDHKLFSEWLHAHYQFASNPGGNGWWEFVNNGVSGDGDDIKGDPTNNKLLCTFSDYNFDRIVPEGVKAYAVTNLTDNGDGSFAVDLMQLLVIPKRTGVILYGVANSKNKNGEPILSMPLCDIANGLPLRRDYWYALESNDNHLKNYLWPTCVSLNPENYLDEGYYEYELDKDGNVISDENGYRMELKTRSVLAENEDKFDVTPWDKQDEFDNMNLNNPQGDYDASSLNGFYRNFYLNYYGTTDPGSGKTPADKDFIGFFRSKKSKMDTNHAFLRLRADEFTDSEGMEVIVNPDTDQYIDENGTTYNMKSYQVEFAKEDGKPVTPSESGYWKDGGDPDMTWENPDNWGERPEGFVIEVKYVGEPIFNDESGNATMIIRPTAESKDSAYYTLQGIRVAKPTTAGVYIHNGKKVVIK